MATVHFGELLDPINDATERLSSVMVWAIGSLLLQGIVLAFVSSTVVKWLFAAIAVGTIATLTFVLRRRSTGNPGLDLLHKFFEATVRIFILAAIVRFIVPAFVLASYLAGQALLQPEIDRNSGELSAISEEVSVVDQQILAIVEAGASGAEDQDEQNPATAEEQQASIIEIIRGSC